MCSYAGELYCKTMLDHLGLDNEHGLYPEVNGNELTNEFINSRRTKSTWSPADTNGGKYILDDGYNGNDDRNDVITDDDFAYFMNDVNDAIDDDDNVLLQNWTIEDLESLWMSADLLTDDAKNSASENSFPVLRDNDVIDEMKRCVAISFLSPISGIETDSLADDQSTTSGASGRLSRQSSFSSSSRSSVSSSVAGSGYFRFDDPLGTCRSTVKSVTRRSSSGKVSKTSRGRNNSLGSSADWRTPTVSSYRPGERDGTSCTNRNGGLRKTLPEVKYLTRQASLESAIRSSRGGGEGEGRSVNYVDGHVDVDDYDDHVAGSEFVRLLLQTRNSNIKNRLTNEDGDYSSIGDQLDVHRSRLQQRRRRQPRRRSTVDGFGDSSESGLNNCHVRSCPTSPEVKPTSHTLLGDFSRQTSLNGHSNIDVTSCDRRIGYARLSPFPVSRLAKSTSREIIQQGPEMKWSQSSQPFYGQGSSPPSQKTPAAVGCRHGNQRRRLLEDHCYSREVVCSERNPSSIGKCSSTVAVRKSNVVSSQINHDGTSSNLPSNQQMTDVVCGSVLELLLRSSGSFPANHGSDALIVEQPGRCRYSSTRRASTACIESIDDDDFGFKSDETVDALDTASDGGPPRGSTLLHRLLTEDSDARTDFQRMSDEKTSLRASNSASESTFQAHSIGELRDAVRATGDAVSPACTIRASSSDSNIITSGDGQSTSSIESNCWPFGLFKWDDDSSSSCSRLTTMTTGDQENPAVDRSRHCWKSSTYDEMAPIEDNEQWMAQYFGHVFQL